MEHGNRSTTNLRVTEADAKRQAMISTFNAVWSAGNARRDLLGLEMERRGQALPLGLRVGPSRGVGPWRELADILHTTNFRRSAFGYEAHVRYQAEMQTLALNWTPALHIEMAEHLATLVDLSWVESSPTRSVAQPVKAEAARDQLPDDLLIDLANEGSETPRGVW